MRLLTLSFAAIGLVGGWLAADALGVRLDAPERWLLTIVTPLSSALLGHWLQQREATYWRLVMLTPVAGMLNGSIIGAIYEKNPLAGILGAVLGFFWSLPFLPALALVLAARRRVGRAREGSIVDAADRRRILSATLTATAFATMVPLLFAHGREEQVAPRVAFAAAIACVTGLCVFLAVDVASLVRVRRLAARRAHAVPRTPAPALETIDFGTHDDASQEEPEATDAPVATYRTLAPVPRAYLGSAAHARLLLAGHVALDVAAIVHACAAVLARLPH